MLEGSEKTPNKREVKLMLKGSKKMLKGSKKMLQGIENSKGIKKALKRSDTNPREM